MKIDRLSARYVFMAAITFLLVVIGALKSFTIFQFFAPKIEPIPHVKNYFPIKKGGQTFILKSQKEIGRFAPVSITYYANETYLVCDYANIYLLRLNAKDSFVKLLSPPKDVKVWVPTGLAYNQATSSLFVANYTGKNVLQLKLNLKSNSLELIQEFAHPELISPEGIAVTSDGQFFAVADYDGNAAFLFNRQGEIQWKVKVNLGHGIDVDDSAVYATSLGDGKILKISRQTGKVVRKTGGKGWSGNRYLWPVFLNLEKGNILITDAHSGRLSFLDRDLNFLSSIGANGNGTDLLNFPYASIFTENKTILIADTFKQRLLEIDLKGHLLRQFLLENTLSSQLDFQKYRQHFLTGTDDLPYTFRQIQYNQIPGDFWNPKLPANLHYVAGYNSLDLIDDNNHLAFQHKIDPPGPPLIGSSYFYITWLAKINLEKDSYYVIGSPQSSGFIIFNPRLNAFSVNNQHSNFANMWLLEGRFPDSYPAGIQNRLLTVVNDVHPAFQEFESLVKSGVTRGEAFQRTLYATSNQAVFSDYLQQQLFTPAGKAFLKQFLEQKDLEQAGIDYFESIKKDKQQYFGELLLVRTLCNCK